MKLAYRSNIDRLVGSRLVHRPKRTQTATELLKENSLMHNFTPVTALLGGMLIGLSASAMLLLDGKIAGISGILAGVLKPIKGDVLWRVCFLAGLLVGGFLLRIFLPGSFNFGIIRPFPILII